MTLLCSQIILPANCAAYNIIVVHYSLVATYVTIMILGGLWGGGRHSVGKSTPKCGYRNQISTLQVLDPSDSQSPSN